LPLNEFEYVIPLNPITANFLKNNVMDGEKEANQVPTRDEEFNFRPALWTDLHGILHGELPIGVVLWD